MRNNRIIRTTIENEVHYGVAEVYYNEIDDNKPYGRTKFIDWKFSSIEELREHFVMIIEDIDKCIALDAILPDKTEENSSEVRSDKPWYTENEAIDWQKLLKEIRQLTQTEE